MKLKFWAGMLISAGLLVFLFSRIDIARLWAVIKSVNPYLLAASAFINLAFFWIRALRWRYFMDPVKKDVPVAGLFSATMIGFMANNVLPARLGEFVRAYAIGRREDISKSSAFATIVVERLFDGMSVLLLLIIVIAFMPPGIAGAGSASTLRKAGIVSLCLYAVMVGLIAFFMYRPSSLPDFVRKVVSPFSQGLAEKAAYTAESFIFGLSVVKDARLLFFILLYSAIHWGLLWFPTYLLFKAFGLPFGIYASVFFLVVACLSVALPSTPGYVGTFHAAAVGGLVLLGMDAGPALGVAILAHATNYIPVTLLGLYCLYRENMSLGSLKKMEAAS